MNKNANTVDTYWAAADAALAVLEMWNTGGEIARRICSEDFRIHFLISETGGSNQGDDVLGAESFARFLDRYRELHPDVVFTEVARAIDGAHGRMLWNVGGREQCGSSMTTTAAAQSPTRPPTTYTAARCWAAASRGTGIDPFCRLVTQLVNQEPHKSAERVFWIVDSGS